MTLSSRVPNISPRNNNGSIILRFQYQKNSYSLSPGGRFGDRLSMVNATRICNQITADILSGNFDPSLQKYLPSPSTTQNINNQQLPSHLKDNNNNLLYFNSNIPKTFNLKNLWEEYKIVKSKTIALTTQKSIWKHIDVLFSKLKPADLKSDKSYLFVSKCLDFYSPSTLKRLFNDIEAMSNWAFNYELIPKNYWKNLKSQLPEIQSHQKDKSRSKKAYSSSEIKLIISAFRNDICTHPSSSFNDSYYANFVEFLYLTGCRPEDAIALTWDSVKENCIIFNKAFSKGILKCTKNNKARLFPINEALSTLLKSQKESIHSINPINLVFPNPSDSYINITNFTIRYMKRVVEKLVESGLVEEYLPTYNIRNTSITHYLKEGLDIATVAALMETSEEVINNHYWSPDKDILSNKIKLPDL